MTRDQRTLAPKRRLFVHEYLKDGNGKQAAIRAGYSPRSAEVEASRLLRNAQVADALGAAQMALRKKASVTAERVIEELARIGFVDPRECFGEDGMLLDPKRFPEHLARAVSGIDVTTVGGDGEKPETTVKIRFWDKPRALHTIAHILGMLKEQVELSTPEGKPLRVLFGGRYRPGDGAAPRRR